MERLYYRFSVVAYASSCTIPIILETCAGVCRLLVSKSLAARDGAGARLCGSWRVFFERVIKVITPPPPVSFFSIICVLGISKSKALRVGKRGVARIELLELPHCLRLSSLSFLRIDCFQTVDREKFHGNLLLEPHGTTTSHAM